MKYRFIQEHQGIHSVERMAGMLVVSRGGYYEWGIRVPSERIGSDEGPPGDH